MNNIGNCVNDVELLGLEPEILRNSIRFAISMATDGRLIQNAARHNLNVDCDVCVVRDWLERFELRKLLGAGAAPWDATRDECPRIQSPPLLLPEPLVGGHTSPRADGTRSSPAPHGPTASTASHYWSRLVLTPERVSPPPVRHAHFAESLLDGEHDQSSLLPPRGQSTGCDTGNGAFTDMELTHPVDRQPLDRPNLRAPLMSISEANAPAPRRPYLPADFATSRVQTERLSSNYETAPVHTDATATTHSSAFATCARPFTSGPLCYGDAPAALYSRAPPARLPQPGRPCSVPVSEPSRAHYNRTPPLTTEPPCFRVTLTPARSPVAGHPLPTFENEPRPSYGLHGLRRPFASTQIDAEPRRFTEPRLFTQPEPTGLSGGEAFVPPYSEPFQSYARQYSIETNS